MALTAGTRLGHYDVTALIGEGGMGQVWQATDTQLGRQVALKILPDAFASDPDRLARFQREAQVLASLNHPNIAQIHGIEEAQGTRALVLELVEGPTLADRIARGPIPLDEALPIARQIAEALEAAHEAGVIHRDLKPANIKVREDGTVKVLDFGLAKALQPEAGGDPSESPTLTAAATRAGLIMGTAAYMSPEQASGAAVDKRADIWSFGVVLFEMLTGRRTFEGETVSHVLAAVLKTDPEWATLPSGTPAAIDRLLRRCLAKERRKRVPDIAVARIEIDDAIEAPVTEATDAGAAPPLQVWQRPMPLAVGMVALLVVTGLVGRSLRSSPEPGAVNRFNYVLPADHLPRRGDNNIVALSPDGRSFVYNTVDGLYLRTMGELEARLIPGTEEDLANPFFSPDGQSVAYWTAAGNQLKRIAISGGAPVVIADASIPYGASWTTDDTILFGQPEGILRVSATGGTPEVLIPSEAGERLDGPHLLPGGDSVLFSAGTTSWSAALIVVQSLSSGERTVLVEGGSDARYLQTGHLVYARGGGVFAVALDLDRVTVSGGEVPLVQGVRMGSGATGTANYGVSDEGTLVYLRAGTAPERTLVWVDRAGREEAIGVPPGGYRYPRISPGRSAGGP